MRKKILLPIGIFFLVIILLIVGLLLLSQTQYFRDFVRIKTQSIVSSVTGQKFSFASLDGNFFNGFRFTDVSFVVEGETFVSAKEVRIDYAFFHMLNNENLFSKFVPIDSLSVTDLNVNLIKYTDDTWNFQKIGERSEKEEDKKGDDFPAWTIDLSEFLLTQGKISLEDRSSKSLSVYEIPEIDLSVKLIDIYRAIDLNLKKAALNAPDQNLTVSDFSTEAYYSQEKFKINDLKALFNGAQINLNADAENLEDKPKFSLDASIENYTIEKIGTINLQAKGNGEYISSNDIRANATIDMPESEILKKRISGTLEEITMSGTTININEGNFTSDLGEIFLSGDIDLNRIITKEGNNNFDLTLKLENIKTTEIFSLIETASNEEELNFPVDTKLGAVLNSEINTTGSWEEFSDLGVKTDIKKFEIKGEQAGDLKLSGTADYTNSTAGVDIDLNLDKVNLGSILADMNFSSDITSKFDIEAQIPLEGNLLDNLTADVDGSFKPSSIFGINLTDGSVDFSYQNQILDIKSLELNSDKNKLEVSGKSPEPLGADFAYEIEIENLSFLSGLSPDLALAGNLKASGDVTGSLKKPTITIDGEVLNFDMNESYNAKSLKIEGTGTVDTEDPKLDLTVDIDTLKLNTKEIREVSLDAKSEGKSVNVNLNIVEDDQFKYEAIASLKDLSASQKDIEISELKLQLEDTTLDNRENILLTIAEGTFALSNFNLYYNDSSVIADASVSGNNIDANLKLSNLSLDDITKALEFQTPIQGYINSSINIKGTKQDPVINATVQTHDLQYKDFNNDNISLSVNYLNNLLDLNFIISDESKSILTAKGTSNINLNLNDIETSLKNADINMTVKSSGLDLSILSGLTDEVVKSEGTLNIDLVANGKLTNPTLRGQVDLQNGLLQTKTIRNEIGIPEALIVMTGQKAVLQTLKLNTSNGSADIEGQLDIPTLSYTVTANLNNLLVKPERISAALTGDINVNGKGEKVDIKGNLTVERARITLPDKEPKELPEIQYVDVEPEEFEIENNQENSFEKNVAINMNVKMIRNNWVRGQGANVELRGDIDIRKDYFAPTRITGNIGVIRGTYENFGKVFRIQQGGTVSFGGRDPIDPFLDITALYRVSSINIFINIGGTASEPSIKLTSDPPMSETDIISYLVFGASSTEISSGERSAIGGVASGVAGGIAAAQLERLMGNVVSLDVVSISGSNVEVGKYLTEDLYIAYERGTTDSIIDSDNITYNKVIVEYHLFNNITLDAEVGGENPGADLFYNFNF